MTGETEGQVSLHSNKRNEEQETHGHGIIKPCVAQCFSAVSTYLFENEEIEDDHAEVVHNECLSKLKRLTVLHVLGPQPEEEQVG